MVHRRINFSGAPAGNPLINALLIVAGALALGALIVFSIVAFLLIASIIAVFAGVVGLRLWWRARKLARAEPPGRSPRPGAGRVIEGEYRNVTSHRDGSRPDGDRQEPD